ncbi:Hint domain-containing protein [Sabulicella glaciei]|uniref:Hint domain-containing protein n=1 Tax=Sabulicella glaciei TaxID=2984948 RepID=A0ABT3NV59_9PROT|nr:Hint domain-containing protein [Roseococcus sp. MDT2-1-1]MCW8086050.1 Hint domain-containing protein [Roseococcus sp. MDT2-1-1]
MALTGLTSVTLSSAAGGTSGGTTTNYIEWQSSLTFTVNATSDQSGQAHDVPVSLQYYNGTSWVEIGTFTIASKGGTSGSVSVNLSQTSALVSQATVNYFAGLNGAAVQFKAVSTSPAFTSQTTNFTFDTVRDSGGDATLTVDQTADNLVNNTEAQSLKLTLSGIDTDAASVTVAFTYNGTTVTKTLTKIGGTTFNGQHTVNLSDLPFGTQGNVTTSMTVTDNAGNVLTKGGTTFQGVICFYPGTLIATPEGERAVETLACGDLVLTSEGKAVPVRWVGRQTISTRFADPVCSLPVRIRAGALGENLPKRDLLVSPGHAMLVDGILATAAALVNGTSILREAAVPEIFTYYHVELADQSLILAEGAPAETFLDDAERGAFDNWAEHEATHDGTPVRELDLPRATSQRQLPAATRQRLAELAARLDGTVAAAA